MGSDAPSSIPPARSGCHLTPAQSAPAWFATQRMSEGITMSGCSSLHVGCFAPNVVGSSDMKVTKYTHACVRVEHDDNVLVIDPGIWSEPHVLFDATAVLVTHEHTDHIDVLRLAGLGVPVYMPASAHVRGLESTLVAPGERFSVAGFDVEAVGGQHAVVYGGRPDCVNLGYIVNDRLYHPGDSFHVPVQPIETLLVPIQASWMKTSEAIEFSNAVKPHRSFPIHDGQINHRGLAGVNAWLARETEGYRYLAPRETL